MTTLDPEDLSWAEAFGARLGATYASPQESIERISRALSDDAHEPMNAQTISHQKRVLGIAEDVELTDAQARAAVPYLMAIAEVVLREAQWALWWRREKISLGKPDPGVEYLVLREEPAFRERLEGFGPRTVYTTEDGVRYNNASRTSTPKIHISEVVADQERRQGGNARVRAAQERASEERAERTQHEERKAQAQAKKVIAAQAKLERPAFGERWRTRRAIKQVERRDRAATRAAEQVHARLERERILKAEEEIRHRRPPAPAPQPYGVNHQGAERFAADWMRHLGVHDAVVTQYSGDGGIDVESRHVVAQVKNLHASASVPIAQIRDLFGTATHRKKGAVLFTSGGVSPNGLTFADETGIALIRYDAEKSTVAGLNRRGRQAIASGFPKAYGFDEFS